MADNLPTPPSPHGGGFGGILKEKWGPLPAWVWVAGGIVILALYLMHRQKAAGGSSNLGSPTQLPNLFEVAGPMPFTGGGTTVSVTTNVDPDKHKKKHHHPKSKIHHKHKGKPGGHRRVGPVIPGAKGGRMAGGKLVPPTGGFGGGPGGILDIGNSGQGGVGAPPSVLRAFGIGRLPRPRKTSGGSSSHPAPLQFPIVGPTHHRKVTVSAPRAHHTPAPHRPAPHRSSPHRPGPRAQGVPSRY